MALKDPIIARSLVDELVARLENAIMVGELPSGTLLREQTLARELGVSRGPLREAIRHLEGRMLVQRKPNIGASVVELSNRDLQDLWVMRAALEGAACGLAATHITDQELAELKRIVIRMEQQFASGTLNGAYDAASEADFHFRIIRASRNQRLEQLICGDMHYLLKVYRNRLLAAQPQRTVEAMKEHRAITEVLESRDPVKAEAAMRQHIGNSLANILRTNSLVGPTDELDTPVITQQTNAAQVSSAKMRAARAVPQS